MANKATPDKTAKVSPGQTQGKATRSRRELKKKFKKAGHVAIAATELEKPVRDQWGKTKGENVTRGARPRQKAPEPHRAQGHLYESRLEQSESGHGREDVQGPRADEHAGRVYRIPGPLPPVVLAEGRRCLPEEDAARRLVLAGYGLSRGLVFYECLALCVSTRFSRYRCRWLRCRLVGSGLSSEKVCIEYTYIGSYVAGPKRGRRCVVKRLKGEKGRLDRRPDARFSKAGHWRVTSVSAWLESSTNCNKITVLVL